MKSPARIELEGRAQKMCRFCQSLSDCEECPLDKTGYCDMSIIDMSDEEIIYMISIWNNAFPHKTI